MKYFLSFLAITLLIPTLALANELSPAQKYQAKKKVSILIVPGHDNEFSGTVFNGTKEADINLKLAEKLIKELKADPLLSVTMSRAKDGYIPELSNYFINNEQAVKDFIAEGKAQTQGLASSGIVQTTEQVPHGDAPSKAAYQLYATNKWAEEKGFDLIIHIHFNDYGSRGSVAGEFTGYSIYVPDNSLLNNERSLTIGTAIGKRLHSVWNTSNALSELKKIDENGVIEDAKLIALGSNRTLNTPSILIEYSYIYEPTVTEPFFTTTSTAFARATFVGLREYLSGKKSTLKPFKYDFVSNLTISNKSQPEVLMLQYALSNLKLFPSTGKTRNDCPFNGVYDECTKSAVKSYQKLNKMTADGVVGKQTRALLNKTF